MKEKVPTVNRLKLLPSLFRKQDAEKVAPHPAAFLIRAVKKGLIHHLNRGNYINSFLYGLPSVEQVACFLRPPAYVSCEWALNHHGIILQAPRVCTVITLSTSVGKNRTVEYQGIVIEFSRITPKLFGGFFFENGVYMALPEKAILDTIYFRRRVPAEDEIETDSVDRKVLLKMAEKYPLSIRARIEELFG